MMTTILQESTSHFSKAGFGRYVPPIDVLRDVFTPEVRQAWQAKPTDELIDRLIVLCACGPYPSDPFAAYDLLCWRARKAALEAYLFTAFSCGMFEGDRGEDLRARLRSRNADNFRAAVAECQACWFLAGKMKLSVAPSALGRGGKNLDLGLRLAGVELGVEVKAPYRETPTKGISYGDDSDKISQVMNAAERQFRDDQPNILVLVPDLRWPLFNHRRDLLKAAFGQSKITWQVNTQTGKGGPTEVKFFPDGKFLNTTTPTGKPLKDDGFPGYRRISIVLCLEERLAEKYPFPNPCALLNEETRSEIWPLWERARDLHRSSENEAWIEHNVLVMHNPHAYHPLGQETWKDYPQLVPSGDVMAWTDGEEVVV